MTNNNTIRFTLGVGVVSSIVLLFAYLVTPKPIISPVPDSELTPTITLTPSPTSTPTPQPTKAPMIQSYQKTAGVWEGKVSHYSREGCLGCSENLTMANGETLDDSRMTIAFNWLPMNTKVRLTNLDNGKTVEATVTDTGGFNRLGRIADLVPAVANVLETKTDVSTVRVEAL